MAESSATLRLLRKDVLSPVASAACAIFVTPVGISVSGILSLSPTWIESFSDKPFAASNELARTPYLIAIDSGVSPFSTICCPFCLTLKYLFPEPAGLYVLLFEESPPAVSGRGDFLSCQVLDNTPINTLD